MGRLLVTTATVVATLSWQLAWQGCASAAPSARFNVKKGDDDVFRGTAAWTVRATSGGREDVVAVPGVGEVIVGEGRCRLVRGGGALGAITVVPSVVPGACADVQGDRLCFNAVAFRDEGGDVVVDGCADRNEVFLERIDEEAPIGVGPAVFVERCAPLNAPALSYVRVSDIVVDGNNRARHGLRFRYSDGFEVCFLSRPEGRFTLTLEVEDPSPRQVVLSGDVDDL